METAPSIGGQPTYRGIKTEGLTTAERKETMDRMVGTRIRWDAPSSTSLDPGVAWDFAPQGIIFEIVESDARYIAPISVYPNEREAIVLAGAEFDVLKTTDAWIETKYGRKDVRMVVLRAIS